MEKVFRTIRYSSVGVILAGIITAISGCSDEDSIRAIILFLILLLTGGGGEQAAMDDPGTAAITVCVSGGTAACAIDLYTDTAVATNHCNGNNVDVSTDPALGAVGGSREIRDSPIIAVDATVNVSIGSGTLLATNIGTASCSKQIVVYPKSGKFAPAIDLSAYTTVVYTVTTGFAGSLCLIMVDSGGVPPIDNARIAVLPVSVGDHTVALGPGGSSFDPTDVAGIVLDAKTCGTASIPGGVTIAMSPLILSP